MKKRTTRSIVRGYIKKLRDLGYEIQKNGQVRNPRGQRIGKETLERKVRSLSAARPPKLRDVTPKPPKRVKMERFEELKPGLYTPEGKRLRLPKGRKSIAFDRGPQAVQTAEWKREKKILRAILGYEPSRSQVERAVLRRMLERRPRIPSLTWQEVESMVRFVPKRKDLRMTANERIRQLHLYSLDFYNVMRILSDRGVLDDTKFRRVAQRFGVKLHHVYDVFFGYPPSVGSRAA